MKLKHVRLLAVAGTVALLFGAIQAMAQTAPPLGVAQRFSVLGNSAVTGSTGTGTVVTGDVGSSPTPSISNFPPSVVNAPFALHLTNDLTVQQAHSDAIAAYGFLAAQGPGTVLGAQLDGAVLTSGIYSFTGGAADLANNGTLTLNGGGVFVFQVDSSLTVNTGSTVTGTADPCLVFWRIGTSATLNGVSFLGNVIADASVTVGSSSNVVGRALAGTGATGAVTMAGSGGNTIGGCAALCPFITVNPATLPTGAIGVSYSQPITATGGSGTYTYTVPPLTLPPGLTLTPGGLLSGMPSTSGSWTFTITATDANGCTGFRIYTLVINPAACPTLTILPATLPEAMVGVPYNTPITASGSTPDTYVYTVTGLLPPGVPAFAMIPATSTKTANLSGTATAVGPYTFTITATDAAGCQVSQTYTLVIVPYVYTIPTLSGWAMLLLAGLLALSGFAVIRRLAT